MRCGCGKSSDGETYPTLASVRRICVNVIIHHQRIQTVNSLTPTVAIYHHMHPVSFVIFDIRAL